MADPIARWSTVALLLVVPCACDAHVERPDDVVPTVALSDEEAHVVEIARRAVAERDDWVGPAEFGRPERRADGTWRVGVWRLPKTPGGDRLVEIDGDGQVVGYVRGH